MQFALDVVTFAVLCISFVFAQNIRVDAPTAGQVLAAGQTFTARLTLMDYIQNLQQVSIVIGLMHCPTSASCNQDPSEVALGTILYQGGYNPTYNPQERLVYQDLTLTVPSGESKGVASLSVAHFYLVGASLVPILSVTGTTVNID